jgi:hypothetical protein
LPHQKSLQLYYTEVAASKKPHQKSRIKKAASKKGVNFAAHRTSEMNYRFEQSIQFLKSAKHKLL